MNVKVEVKQHPGTIEYEVSCSACGDLGPVTFLALARQAAEAHRQTHKRDN